MRYKTLLRPVPAGLICWIAVLLSSNIAVGENEKLGDRPGERMPWRSLLLEAGLPVKSDSGMPLHLPDPLTMNNGTKIASPAQWRSQRRPELLELFTRQMYGVAPTRPAGMRFEVYDSNVHALGENAIRRQIAIFFTGETNGPRMDLLIYLPSRTEKPVPMILGINFWGNHAIHSDPGIRINTNWMESNRNPWIDLSSVTNNQASEASRGINSSQWPVEKILARGFGLATFYRGDITRDFPGALTNGLLANYPELQKRDDNFSTIGAWAWALSRALDYLETDRLVDAKRVAVFGWSRLGKTALWAGASDERFALVVSQESGAGGAKLFHRGVGESVSRLNTVFPHWFCANFRQYSNHDTEMPFDQHELIALIAPRPVYIASAEQDLGADPLGEFYGALAANPVYKLFGLDGLPTKTPPALNESSQGRMGYHMRAGGHDVTDLDWRHILDFAQKHLSNSR